MDSGSFKKRETISGNSKDFWISVSPSIRASKVLKVTLSSGEENFRGKSTSWISVKRD